MKLRNLSIATIILLLIGFGFTSCEPEREYYQASTFKIEFDAYAVRGGDFQSTRRVRVDSEFFSNFRPARDEVRDIRFYGGWLQIGNMTIDDRIYEVNIAINGTRVYSRSKGWSLGGKEYVWIGDDRDLDDAISDILYSIGGNGWVDVTFYGKSNLRDEGPLQVDLFADVELLIRD